MSVKLLTEHHFEFLSLMGGCTGSSESTHVKMPHYWKSHVTARICICRYGRDLVPGFSKVYQNMCYLRRKLRTPSRVTGKIPTRVHWRVEQGLYVPTTLGVGAGVVKVSQAENSKQSNGKDSHKGSLKGRTGSIRTYNTWSRGRGSQGKSSWELQAE